MFLKRFNLLEQLVSEAVFTLRETIVSEEEMRNGMHLLFSQVKESGGIIYVIGNGGSAAIASHFCTDLIRTLDIRAATLNDPALFTCFANDFGYENAYGLLLKKMLNPKDLLVAISSSGKSKNILNAVEEARVKKVSVITLSGFSSLNPLRKKGDLNIWLDSQEYGLVEMGHFFILHTLIDFYSSILYRSHAGKN